MILAGKTHAEGEKMSFKYLIMIINNNNDKKYVGRQEDIKHTKKNQNSYSISDQHQEGRRIKS